MYLCIYAIYSYNDLNKSQYVYGKQHTHTLTHTHPLLKLEKK